MVWSRQWWTTSTTTTGPVTRVLRNKAPLKAMPGSTVFSGENSGDQDGWGLNQDAVRSRDIRSPGLYPCQGGSTHIELEYIGLTGQFLSEGRSNPLEGADTYLNIFLWFLAAPQYYRMRSYFYWVRFLHRCLIKIGYKQIGYRKSGVDFRQEWLVLEMAVITLL